MSTQRGRQYACGVCLLLSLTTGCRHRVVAAAVPPAPLEMISVPPPTHHSDVRPTEETELSEALTLEVERVPLPRFRPRPTTAKQLAMLLPPPPRAVVLGELTTGGEADNGPLQQETKALLDAQQLRLRSLPASAGQAHRQDVNQATLFLRQAFDAWRKRDIEGARVLATKAKVLLDDTEQ